ncbi:MAG: head-tail connector protein [Paracoccus sp. (in: a-proteobacteria)]
MITLAEAKMHLRVDHDDTDAEIAGMIEAAEEYLASIGCDVTEPAPAPLKQAALILITNLFQTKGLVDENPPMLSGTFMRLVAPYREIEL